MRKQGAQRGPASWGCLGMTRSGGQPKLRVVVQLGGGWKYGAELEASPRWSPCSRHQSIPGQVLAHSYSHGAE